MTKPTPNFSWSGFPIGPGAPGPIGKPEDDRESELFVGRKKNYLPTGVGSIHIINLPIRCGRSRCTRKNSTRLPQGCIERFTDWLKDIEHYDHLSRIR